MGQRRHRDRDRLRHRAVHLQGEELVHALQWAIGLELFLLSRDPWRIVLSTDHPNGGSFLSYPQLIRLLMDRDFRNEQLRRANKQAMQRTVLLDDLDREYTLEEIAIITRAGPARLLGLRDKGHLGVGADADVTIYDDRADREEMFAAPRYVIKGGRVVVRDGELRRGGSRATCCASARRTTRAIERRPARRCSRSATPCSSTTIPVREPWLLEPARTVAAGPRVMQLHGAEVVDTFAEAFTMWGARIVDHRRRRRRWARARGALADRLRHVGDRLQVRGGDRARARRRARRPTGARASPRCCSPSTARALGKRLVERVGQTVLTCPTTACFNGLEAEDDGRRRRPAALLRRRLAGEQGARRAALLARSR